MKMRWQTIAQSIEGLDRDMVSQMQAHLDQLIKPVGSLGRMERLAAHLAGMTASLDPDCDPGLVLIFAGDHGVTQAGVSKYPSDVTAQMLHAYHQGYAAISVMARQAGLDMQVVDVGVASDIDPSWGVVPRKVGRGTKDFRWTEAMTDEEVEQAINVGIEMVDNAVAEGYRTLVLGEIGIGNTTSAATLGVLLLQEDAAVMTGRGTGIDEATHHHKIRVVEQAALRHKFPGMTALDMLSRVGGFEIAAMVGAILAGARHRIPVILDGYMTSVAALTATRIAPLSQHYLIASHQSEEPGHRKVLGALGLEPLVEWGMRLGEASGAALAFPLIRQSLAIPREMATFAQAGVADATSLDAPPLDMGQRRAPGQFSVSERRALYRAIAARRDIRSFRPDPIPPKLLARLLWAAHHGPSVGFSEPWDFIMVTDVPTKQALRDMADRERQVQSLYFANERQDKYLQLKLEGLLEAPVVMVVTADMERGGPEVLGRHTIPETTTYSVACAVQNLWLAARAEGIAVGWVSLFEKRHLRHALAIPAGVEPVAVLCLGYTDRFPEEPILKTTGWMPGQSLAPLVHAERFDGETPEELKRLLFPSFSSSPISREGSDGVSNDVL